MTYDAIADVWASYGVAQEALRARHESIMAAGAKRIEYVGDAVLIEGDCLQVLPALAQVDAVIAYPPFGIGFKYSQHIDDTASYAEMMMAMVAALPVAEGPCVFWQGMPNADKWHQWFPPGFRIFAACKGFVQFRPTPVQFSWDPVIFWGKPTAKPSVVRKDFHIQNMAPFGAGRERIAHPCPRPVEQVRYVVECFTSQGESILDPFMGSGTTGVAALQLGRKFIGIELDPGYFDIAVKRCREAWAQPRLFDEPKRKPESAPSFFDEGS